jgi:hypothetical protein
MSEQGTNHANPKLDDERKHEAQPIVQGHGPSHVEEWRQTVPYPDDTDPQEVQAASGIQGPLREAPGSLTEGAVTEDDDRA